MNKIAIVVPTIRQQQLEEFKVAWRRLFDYHQVTLVVVHDSDEPELSVNGERLGTVKDHTPPEYHHLLSYRTDACRDGGFLWVAENLDADVIISYDDDVRPPDDGTDCIQQHLDILGKSCSISWMNTASGPEPFFRGVPFATRTESRVVVSHGTWTQIPDYDAPTQLLLTGKIDPNPPFVKMPVPRHCYLPICGMNLAFLAEALPLAYYVPQGVSTGTRYQRFADIWMGVIMKRKLDERGLALATGYSTVRHARASDVFHNLSQEAEGLRQNELFWKNETTDPYFDGIKRKSDEFEEAIKTLQANRKSSNLAQVGKALL